MSFYEISLLLSPKLSLEEANALVSTLESSLQNNGKIEGERKIEMKKLAYLIEGYENAWFSLINFYPQKSSQKSEILTSLKKQLKEEKNIIRHLIVKKEKVKIKKSSQRIAAARAKTEAQKKEAESLTKEPIKQKAGFEEVEERLKEMLGE
ncbi:MAG TPA: 30S ribosomal protein S6 [Candidatus Pacearchaeota archaeon]|jgi:ribosomal protein S6|nr:30S ribosomal protein S6 [Candidatus Pacearchaeota archaeon]HQG09513.1 30S ribosomal protein S6 [Candidatus Pacearchaeota archaeon]HQH20470.1 30S ribosomal protein S6 [Candidatus Pacearchaeota archaeon]